MKKIESFFKRAPKKYIPKVTYKPEYKEGTRKYVEPYIGTFNHIEGFYYDVNPQPELLYDNNAVHSDGIIKTVKYNVFIGKKE